MTLSTKYLEKQVVMKCPRCGKHYTTAFTKFDNEQEWLYDGAGVDQNPCCYDCWGKEYENRKPHVISYSLTSYTTEGKDIIKEEIITIEKLPSLVDLLLRKTGYSLQWILIRESYGEPKLNFKHPLNAALVKEYIVSEEKEQEKNF